MCKKVVEGCGGKISASKSTLKSENPEKHGTTFSFQLPVIEELPTFDNEEIEPLSPIVHEDFLPKTQRSVKK